MTFAEKNRIFLKKLQDLPDRKKKIILWTVVAILAAVMGFFWVRSAIDNFSKMGESVKNIKMPEMSVSEDITSGFQDIGNQLDNLNNNLNNNIKK